jgi:16S rRNA (cytosine967-C5)-methyltransferase
VSGSSERSVAARLLIRVESGAFSSRLLGSGVGPGVRARVLGVLRWQRALDHCLAARLRRPLADLDPEVRAVLRLGLYEAVLLGVPAAVATDGAVHLARRLGRGSASGLVNAVLRRAVVSWAAVGSAPPDLELSHPEWLYRRWVDRLGEAAARRVMSANQVPRETWVWFLRGEGRDRLETEGVRLEAHPWCPGAWSAPGRAAALLSEVAGHGAYAQDPSSQLVGHVAAALAGDGTPRLADLCTAPGGKLALLLTLRRCAAAVGLELHLGRARLARPPVAAVGGGAGMVCADATLPPLRPGSWDLVVVDAPCSGTGTLGRHPELKWRLSPTVLPDLARRQRLLVGAGCELLAPGGALLYATCSIEPEENEDVVGDLAPGLERIPIAPLLPAQVPYLETELGGVRLLPDRVCDGFTLHGVRRAR